MRDSDKILHMRFPLRVRFANGPSVLYTVSWDLSMLFTVLSHFVLNGLPPTLPLPLTSDFAIHRCPPNSSSTSASFATHSPRPSTAYYHYHSFVSCIFLILSYRPLLPYPSQSKEPPPRLGCALLVRNDEVASLYLCRILTFSLKEFSEPSKNFQRWCHVILLTSQKKPFSPLPRPKIHLLSSISARLCSQAY